jgi:glutamate synthase (ferredoxin)
VEKVTRRRGEIKTFSKVSGILKQCQASGFWTFCVSINYLTSAKEIQIKMAQGAKPGGEQLPGEKKLPWLLKPEFNTICRINIATTTS